MIICGLRSGMELKILEFQACCDIYSFVNRGDEAMWRHEVIRPHQRRGLVLSPRGGCAGSHDRNEHRQTAEDYKSWHERVEA